VAPLYFDDPILTSSSVICDSPEQSVLFASLLKWFVIASIIGVIVGGATTLFLQALGGTTQMIQKWPYYYLLLPIGMFLSSLIIQYLSPTAEGHGTEAVIEAIHQQSGKIKPSVVPIKLLATIITLATGGSAGKEGPCAQIGAGLSSLLADLLRVTKLDRVKLVTCGISAGFAAVFGTPIAGAIFGVEVLAIGQIQYTVLFPSFVAGIMAYETSSYFGITYFHNAIPFNQPFNELFFSEILLIGLACGLCAFLFIETLQLVDHLSGRIRIWKPLKGLIGGALVLLTLGISKRYLGLGLPIIEGTLQGQPVYWYDFLVKMVATAVTLSFGGSGGIITPVFFVGSTFGSFLATLLHLSPVLLAALGMVGLLSGCANTPIAASIMAMEIFGTSIGPYAAMVAIISFVFTGHRSVYPSQVLRLRKSDSLEFNMGDTIRNIRHVDYKKK
jgi:H+/Cl- antiporter ClcA